MEMLQDSPPTKVNHNHQICYEYISLMISILNSSDDKKTSVASVTDSNGLSQSTVLKPSSSHV